MIRSLRPLTTLALSTALLLSAAAQTTDPVRGSTAVKGDITFLTNKSDVVKGMIPAFEKLYPNVKVTLVPVGAADLLSKVTTLAAAGQMPADVIQVEGYNVEFLARRFPNLFQDLTSWTSKYQASFSKAQIQEGTVGGKRYGLPIEQQHGGAVLPHRFVQEGRSEGHLESRPGTTSWRLA